MEAISLLFHYLFASLHHWWVEQNIECLRHFVHFYTFLRRVVHEKHRHFDMVVQTMNILFLCWSWKSIVSNDLRICFARKLLCPWPTRIIEVHAVESVLLANNKQHDETIFLIYFNLAMNSRISKRPFKIVNNAPCCVAVHVGTIQVDSFHHLVYVMLHITGGYLNGW